MVIQRKFQVFVSSTFKDLRDERQAVIEALLNAGNIPAGMEYFTVGSESQLETMYRWIGESDFYLLVLGGSYGTIDQVRKKSYTQLEYEYARKNGKDVRAIELSEEYLSAKGLFQNQDDDYKRFIDIVSDEAQRVYSLDGLEKSVYKICIDYMRNYDTGGWVRADYANENAQEKIHLMKKVEELENKNKELNERIQSLENNRFGDYTFEELLEVLKARSIVNEEGETLSLLDVFMNNIDTLTHGFVLDDEIGQKLYGSLVTFKALGLLWIATSVTPQRLRTSKMGGRFYLRQQLTGN